jgi:hypothetical protein
MRALAISEISFVSGGMEEVVISAPRIKPGVIVIKDTIAIMNLLDQLDRHSGGGGGGEVLDEVVIEAPRDCEDHCTLAPDLVPESCEQHDKDYSEDSKLDRKEADERFRENMKKELAERYPHLPQAVREAIADGYYKAVREAGHLFYKGQGVNDRVVTEGDDIPRIPRF